MRRSQEEGTEPARSGEPPRLRRRGLAAAKWRQPQVRLWPSQLDPASPGAVPSQAAGGTGPGV